MFDDKMCFCLTFCSSVHPKSEKPQGNFWCLVSECGNSNSSHLWAYSTALFYWNFTEFVQLAEIFPDKQHLIYEDGQFYLNTEDLNH